MGSPGRKGKRDGRAKSRRAQSAAYDRASLRENLHRNPVVSTFVNPELLRQHIEETARG